MTIAFIVTLVVLGIVIGFAVRQMRSLYGKDAQISSQVESLHGKSSVIEKQAYEIRDLKWENEGLRAENQSLSDANKAHVSNLEMVLNEMDQPA